MLDSVRSVSFRMLFIIVAMVIYCSDRSTAFINRGLQNSLNSYSHIFRSNSETLRLKSPQLNDGERSSSSSSSSQVSGRKVADTDAVTANAEKRREWDLLAGVSTVDCYGTSDDSIHATDDAAKTTSATDTTERDAAAVAARGSIIRQVQLLPLLPTLRIEAPAYLDGSLAGDAGFDPLRLARNAEGLQFFREAEIKHGRIAMLAAVGWPFSELYHYQLSSSAGFQDLLATGGKAPSVLNGGLDNVYALFALGLFFAVGGVLEFELQRRRREAPPALQNFMQLWREDDWDAPGNYGFDPLDLRRRLCGEDASRRVIVQSVEIFNARMAMLATTGFVVQEYFTGLPVVTETPQFFSFGPLM